MAYKTLKNPGDAPTTGGGQAHLKGLKITTNADIAINQRLTPGQKDEAVKLFLKIREGSAPTNTGTYTVNGFVCYHAKFNGQAHALAWRAPVGDTFTYVEAVIAKTGSGNTYAEV